MAINSKHANSSTFNHKLKYTINEKMKTLEIIKYLHKITIHDNFSVNNNSRKYKSTKIATGYNDT